MNKIVNMKSKKGVVFTVIGAFTLLALMYLFMIFLDLFNIMYTQVVFQGDARASALHAANYVDYDQIDGGPINNRIVIQSRHGSAYDLDQTAEYNAQKLFAQNFRKHYSMIEGAKPTDFDVSLSNINYQPDKFKVRVFNLVQKPDGIYIPETESPPGYGVITHTEPGVSVYVELELKPWTFFFDGYKIRAYSYGSPVLTNSR